MTFWKNVNVSTGFLRLMADRMIFSPGWDQKVQTSPLATSSRREEVMREGIIRDGWVSKRFRRIGSGVARKCAARSTNNVPLMDRRIRSVTRWDCFQTIVESLEIRNNGSGSISTLIAADSSRNTRSFVCRSPMTYIPSVFVDTAFVGSRGPPRAPVSRHVSDFQPMFEPVPHAMRKAAQ